MNFLNSSILQVQEEVKKFQQFKAVVKIFKRSSSLIFVPYVTDVVIRKENNMKKIASILIAMTLVAGMPVNVLAQNDKNISDNTVDKFVSTKGVPFSEVENMKPISESEKNALIEDIVQNNLQYIQESRPTIEDRINILKNVDQDLNNEELKAIENDFILEEQKLTEEETIQSEENANVEASAATQSTYDENKKKLRTGNLIEETLNLDEGFTSAQLVKVVKNASSAKSNAKKKYPNDSDLEDAYRHYNWNYLMKNSLSKSKARKAANNHEWGLVILTPVINTYDQAYDDYIDAGYSKNTAANYAFTDTLASIPETKSYTYKICESKYSKFIGFFDDDNVMDLTNNCYGRAATSSVATAFENDLDDGNVITSADSVTSAQRYAVWSNDWYGY